jgi:hypothetical protein
MAAVWITEIKNFSPHHFTLYQNDGTWHPIINGRGFKPDEPIAVPAARDTETTFFMPIGFPPTVTPVVIPPGPAILQCQYFFVGWTDFARTRIQGPDGGINVMVGPTGFDNENDFLRVFDDEENEIASIEMGPRGSGFVCSLDLHLNFDDDKVRWLIWNANGVGADVLERADKLFMPELAKALGKLLFGGLLGGGPGQPPP